MSTFAIICIIWLLYLYLNSLNNLCNLQEQADIEISQLKRDVDFYKKSYEALEQQQLDTVETYDDDSWRYD